MMNDDVVVVKIEIFCFFMWMLEVNLNDFYLFVQVVDVGSMLVAVCWFDLLKLMVSKCVVEFECMFGVWFVYCMLCSFWFMLVGVEFFEYVCVVVIEVDSVCDVVLWQVVELVGVVWIMSLVLVVQYIFVLCLLVLVIVYLKLLLQIYVSD